MKSITHNHWLNRLILLYQEKIIKIDIRKIATKFTAGRDLKKAIQFIITLHQR